MANIPGTIVADPVSIGDTLANKFGSHYGFMGIGGAYEVFNLEELNAIPVKPAAGVMNTGDPTSSGRRRLGMTVFVYSENKYFKLYDPAWNTYTTDLERYNSLSSNSNWKEAFSDQYLPLTGGKLSGKVEFPNGSYAAPSITFPGTNSEGLFNDPNLGVGIASKGRQFQFTSQGIDMINSPLINMAVGEGNTVSANYAFVFGSYSKASNYVTTAIGTVVNATGQYSTGLGSYANANGNNSTVVGVLSTTSGFRATAVGNNLAVQGNYAVSVGVYSDNNSSYSTTVGAYLAAPFGTDNSALVGSFLSTSKPRSIVIGTGINTSNRLQNNIGNSIFLGSNSNVPSLFVGGGNGTAGSLGNIGVNLTTPSARLDILEGNTTVAPFRIRKSIADKPSLLEGEFQFSTTSRLKFSPDGVKQESFAYLSDLSTISTTSPLISKGDLWGYSTTDVRIPIGQGFLSADPASETGVTWRNLSSYDITAALGYTPENTLNKGLAGGYCELDSAAKVPLSRIPQSLLGATIYKGTWDAVTNTPTLQTGQGEQGHYYVVNNPGTTAIDGISDWGLGDWIIFNGIKWEKVDNTDAIISFNNRTGAITLQTEDILSALGYTPYSSLNPAGYIDASHLTGYVNRLGDSMAGTLGLFRQSPLRFSLEGVYEADPAPGTMEWNPSFTENIAFSPAQGNRKYLAFTEDIPFVISGYNKNAIKSRFGNLTSEGLFSFAIGNFNKATGNNSFTTGVSNNSWGDNSFTTGASNTCAANNSHAEGATNTIAAYNGHAEGSNNTIGNPIRNFTASGGAIGINGNYISEFPASFPILFFNLTGSETPSFSRVIANSFYNGYVTIVTFTEPLPLVSSGSCVVPTFGLSGHAEGQNNLVKGTAAHAEGASNQALTNYSHAQGFRSIASGYGAHAQGSSTTSSGYFSHSQGYFTVASGQYSHAEGAGTTAAGGQSHAEGNGTLASGWNAHAEGESTISSGSSSHSEGAGSEATANYAHAGGLESRADKHAQFARSGGKFVYKGDAQYSQLYPRVQTTDGQIKEMTLNLVDKMTIPVGKVWAFSCHIVAKQVGGTAGIVGACVYFTGNGLVKNIGGAIALVGVTTNIAHKDSGTNAWALSVVANNTEGTLKMDVTGEAGKTINWSATVNLFEVA